jgi:hypothetical protein
MFKYERRPAILLFLRLLDFAVENDAYANVLDVLEQGLNKAKAHIDDAVKSGSEEYAEAVADTETGIIEGLLGAAYVVCQTQINSIVQEAIDCRKQIVRDGRTFTAFGDHDYDVRRLGPRFDVQWSKIDHFPADEQPQYKAIVQAALRCRGDVPWSKIELIWELANYFKHRDEWSSDSWTNPQGREKRTIPVLIAAGLRSFSNLQSGADALGYPDYANISVLQTVIREWADQVRGEIRKAAGR